MDSPIKIYVERNLGFEAEHHARDLGGMPGVMFHQDVAAKRIGVLTTDAVKHAMCGLLNSMLREKRVHIAKVLFWKLCYFSFCQSMYSLLVYVL